MKNKLNKAVHLVREFLENSPKCPLVVIVGPTASGKTALSIPLARKFGGEIISADSRQIYREVDRGTAKPTARELRAIPHHLISTHSPRKVVDVVMYRELVEKKIRALHRRKKIPFLVGSHNLLISAIVENYIFPEVKNNPALRARLEKIYVTKSGPLKLWRRLQKANPSAATKIPPANRYHLIRALELAETVGASEIVKNKGTRKYSTLLLGLNPPREKLYVAINSRVDKMLRAGLLPEVKRLVKKYPRHTPALRGHGYRELLDYLHGEKSREQAIEEIKRDTRHYAKRQTTWWRNAQLKNEIHWL